MYFIYYITSLKIKLHAIANTITMNSIAPEVMILMMTIIILTMKYNLNFQKCRPVF